MSMTSKETDGGGRAERRGVPAASSVRAQDQGDGACIILCTVVYDIP